MVVGDMKMLQKFELFDIKINLWKQIQQGQEAEGRSAMLDRTCILSTTIHHTGGVTGLQVLKIPQHAPTIYR